MPLKPWREVAVPHDDVLTGTFQQAEFAADLARVHAGTATEDVLPAIRERLQQSCATGVFGGVHVFTPSSDVPDDWSLRLVVLPPEAPFSRRKPASGSPRRTPSSNAGGSNHATSRIAYSSWPPSMTPWRASKTRCAPYWRGSPLSRITATPRLCWITSWPVTPRRR